MCDLYDQMYKGSCGMSLSSCRDTTISCKQHICVCFTISYLTVHAVVCCLHFKYCSVLKAFKVLKVCHFRPLLDHLWEL